MITKMLCRYKNYMSILVFRPWLAILVGVWVGITIACYWLMMSRLNTLDTHDMDLQHFSGLQSSYWVPSIPDKSGTLCETIHISMVCMGKCTQQITPMLKSLLHHRQNPLHFHFIVDVHSGHIMSTLMETWDLPDVKYTCYNAQKHYSKVDWVPNGHQSGVYGLLKLLFPDILPKTLEKVIVLDSDLTFLSDIAELWNMFENMSGDQCLGLVENESNWYFGADRWPAIGRGYNTGVMLLRLGHMTLLDWSALWKRAVFDHIDRLKKTNLADQDVINAVLTKHPSMLYPVGCQYNVQLSTQSLAKGCYGEDVTRVKIIHWNSPVKHDIKLRDAAYFRSRHHQYESLDGYLLRDKLHRCTPSTRTDMDKSNVTDPCANFRLAQRVKLRTHVDYAGADGDAGGAGGGAGGYEGAEFDVTLVVQLSVERLLFLERLVKYWDGPLSAAIYLSDCETHGLARALAASPALARRGLRYSLVFKHHAVHYPVNYLRNVALARAPSPFVLLLDVDFVPSAGLHARLRRAVPLTNLYPQKKCLVIPAFETQRYRASPPRTKRALLARLARASPNATAEAGGVGGVGAGDVAPFRLAEWPRGHRATNYSRWLTATKPYEVAWQADYEPYLVVHRSVPRYDTRFSGFGWNKVSHSVELRARGYRAVVLPDAFAVHTPHAPSPDIAAFRADPRYRVCLALLKQEFMEDLKKKYNFTLDETAKSDAVVLTQDQIANQKHEESHRT